MCLLMLGKKSKIAFLHLQKYFNFQLHLQIQFFTCLRGGGGGRRDRKFSQTSGKKGIVPNVTKNVINATKNRVIVVKIIAIKMLHYEADLYYTKELF